MASMRDDIDKSKRYKVKDDKVRGSIYFKKPERKYGHHGDTLLWVFQRRPDDDGDYDDNYHESPQVFQR